MFTVSRLTVTIILSRSMMYRGSSDQSLGSLTMPLALSVRTYNHDWLGHDDPARTQAVLDHAIYLWRRKERMFRDCGG